MVTLSLRSQYRAWKSVLFALFLREWQSKFNDKFGLGWAFLEPFAFIALLSFGRGLIREGDVHSIPLAIFMMIGLLALQSFTTALGSVSNSVKRNKPLYAFRQVQPVSALVVSTAIECSIKTGVIALIALALYLSKTQFSLSNPLLLITLFILIWVFTFSISTLFGIAMAFVPEVKKIQQLATRPLMFISCIFFSLQDIPEQYWHWLTWNPLVHFIELARYACYESYGHRGVSLLYAFNWSFISLFFALSVYHISWKRMLAR